jgi:hypothetical protein
LQTLASLRKEGRAALPAIREFLEGKQDLDFESLAGAGSLGYPTLRLAMLSIAQEAGGPEALDLFVWNLQTTSDPREISLSAGSLERESPGQYREVALNAARGSLTLASEGKLAGKDVGPLFDVFLRCGREDVVPDLERAAGQWKHYAAIALAGLPEGAGVPTLIQLAKGGPDGSTASQVVGLQMLAQVAAWHPEAHAVLMEEARANRIPDAAWLEMASGLEGRSFQIGKQAPDAPWPEPGQSGIQSYHLAYGNQNYYSREVISSWSPEQVNHQLALIDQLLEASSSAFATQALQQARSTLRGALERK